MRELQIVHQCGVPSTRFGKGGEVRPNGEGLVWQAEMVNMGVGSFKKV